MKKLLLLVPMILLVAAACNSKPTPQTNQQNNNQQQVQPSTTNQGNATGQETDWKTYTNNRVGYQFEYPAKGLTLPFEETIKYPDSKNYNEDLVQFAIDSKVKSEQQPVTFGVRTYVGVKSNSIEDWIQNGNGSNPNLANYTKRAIDGQTTYTGKGISVTYVLHNNNVYVIDAHAGIEPAHDTDPVYQHLFSTFKFTSATSRQTDNYLTIKEWGVKFEKPQGMSDLLYVTKPYSYSTDNTVALITQKLVDLNKSIGSKCNGYYLGLLMRVTENGLQDIQNNGSGISDYVKVGNYYYYFSLPQEACYYNNSYDNEYAKLSGSQSSNLQATILKTLKAAP